MPDVEILVTYHEKGVSFKSLRNGGEILYQFIDGNFPTWKSVIPKEPFQKAELSFNYNLLDGFGKLSKILLPKQAANLTVKAHGAQAPFSIFIADSRFYGLLMPLRDTQPEVPKWLLED